MKYEDKKKWMKVKTMKIVVLDGYGLNPGDLCWDGILEIDNQAIIHDTIEQQEVVEKIGDAEIIIVNKIKISRDTLKQVPNLKYIGVLATGYDIVDVEAARDYGVTVTNVPGYGTESVAQFVFALLLQVCNQVAHHEKRVREGAWEEYNEFCFWEKPLIELSGKTLGIVGYGRIGQAVARIGKAFGMNILVNTVYPMGENWDNQSKDGVTYVTLDNLYKNSDVISLHCPLFNENRGMICRDSIDKMKDGVILINTSRGGLIDEADLVQALNAGKIAGAGLDVMINEPPKSDNPLIGAKNCIVTPHIAWAPKEARARLLDIAVENIKAFIKNEKQNVVN